MKKDHVYALLGLVPSDIQNRTRIGYTLSDAEVFVDALRAAIGSDKQSYQLSVLWENLPLLHPTMPGLPSWCPDFSSGYLRGPRLELLSDHFVHAFSKSARLRCLTDEPFLCINVAHVDTVAKWADMSCPTVHKLPGDVVYEMLEEPMHEWLKSLLSLVDVSGSDKCRCETQLSYFLLLRSGELSPTGTKHATEGEYSPDETRLEYY